MARIENLMGTINSRQDEDEADRQYAKSILEQRKNKETHEVVKFTKLPETFEEASDMFSIIMKRAHYESNNASRSSLDQALALLCDGVEPRELESTMRRLLAQPRKYSPPKGKATTIMDKVRHRTELDEIAELEMVDIENLKEVFLKYAIKQYRAGEIKFRVTRKIDLDE